MSDMGHDNAPASSQESLDRPQGVPPLLPGDNPIRSAQQDALGRTAAADAFAQHVLRIDVSEGAAVGVLGAWGSGKTSFVNLARSEFARQGVTVLDFNPWMFSGSEQLVESFFVEIAAQLKLRPGMNELGTQLEEYGEIFSGLGWLPLVGPWIERTRGVAKILAKALQRRKEGIASRRDTLVDSLRKLDKPLVVVLDDIDRLTTPEIRDVFRLVRLTASFPNVIYVVAFDRARVEEALSEDGVPGRLYVEKIIQLVVDLPVIPANILNRQVLTGIDSALEGVENTGPFDEQLWPDVFMEVVRPLMANMRDARRYAAAVSGTAMVLEGHIALVDLLALEAVRVMLPDVYVMLPSSVEALTSTGGMAFDSKAETDRLKSGVDALLNAAGEREDVVRALISRLFPAAARHLGGSNYGPDWKAEWLRERRAAHEDILRLYLEHTVGEGLAAFNDAERAWATAEDADAFRGCLSSLEPERLQDVISALEAFEESFDCQHAVAAVPVLLNLLEDLPRRQRSMLEFDSRMYVARVVYRLIRACKEPDRVEAAVRQILPQVRTLSSKFELVRTVGYKEGAGHKLVSEEAAQDLEKEWRSQVRATNPESLATEWDLLRVLYTATKDADDTEEAHLVLPDTPNFMVALLRSAYSESMSQSMGSRAIRKQPRLAWDVLVEVLGSEDRLAAGIEAAREAGLDDSVEILELATKYASGWRPKDFGDD